MSRVRVYELAKEAGMGSKELADKLIAAGYEIKGHSSTVDDDTADKIRKTMFKKVKAKPETKKAKPKTKKAKAEPKPEPEAEKVEERIEGEGDQKSTVIRRRTTIIRRRAKAEPEALEEAAEESAEQEADASQVSNRTPSERSKSVAARVALSNIVGESRIMLRTASGCSRTITCTSKAP